MENFFFFYLEFNNLLWTCIGQEEADASFDILKLMIIHGIFYQYPNRTIAAWSSLFKFEFWPMSDP